MVQMPCGPQRVGLVSQMLDHWSADETEVPGSPCANEFGRSEIGEGNPYFRGAAASHPLESDVLKTLGILKCKSHIAQVHPAVDENEALQPSKRNHAGFVEEESPKCEVNWGNSVFWKFETA